MVTLTDEQIKAMPLEDKERLLAGLMQATFRAIGSLLDEQRSKINRLEQELGAINGRCR